LEKTLTSPTLNHSDIGNPAKMGTTTNNNGIIEITAGGADIWGASDQFHFAYCEKSGDFQVTVNLETFSKADLYSKAGIMVRETLEAGSKHAFMVAFPDNNLRNHNNGGIEFQYRQETDGECLAIYPENDTTVPPFYPVDFPQVWMKLTRSGDHFDASFSPDGSNWKPYCSYELKLSSALLVGLGVTSHNPAQTVTARFSGLVIE
jgi:regulation of enolase protein 1 (concanavalin A-like superfamily)